MVGTPQLHVVTFFKGFIAVCGSYGNYNHLNTEESKEFKGTATGNWTQYHRGTCWHCRCSLEEDRSQYWYRRMNCGKRTIAPSCPHRIPACYCKSLGLGIPGSLAYICERKQSLKTTDFHMISFLLRDVFQWSRIVRWDHCHGRSGRSEPLPTKWLERWCPQSLPAQNNEISKSLQLFISSSCSLLMLPGCQSSFDHCTRRQAGKLMNPKRGRITLLGRAHPAQAPQAMAITGFATCWRVVFFPPVFYLLVPPLGLLMWIISRWTYGMLSIMAGSFPNPLP